MPLQQKKVLQILNKNYTKEELKLARTSVEKPIIEAIKHSSQSPVANSIKNPQMASVSNKSMMSMAFKHNQSQHIYNESSNINSL